MLLSLIIIGIICLLTSFYASSLFIKGADVRNGNLEAAKKFDDEQMKILSEMRERGHVLETLS